MVNAFNQLRLTNYAVLVTGTGILNVGGHDVVYTSQTGVFSNATTLSGQNAAYYLDNQNMTGAVIGTGAFLTTGVADGRYVDLTNNDTISGTKTFANQVAVTYAGAPFSITNNTLVSNLNVDLLHGHNDTYFVNTGATGIFETSSHASSTYVAKSNTGAFLTTGAGDGRYVQQTNTGNLVDKGSAQTISGAKTFNVQQAFTFAGAPFTVSNTGLVVNLNADLLDGHSENYFVNTSQTGNFITTGQTGTFSNATTLSGQAASYYLNNQNMTGAVIGTGAFLTTGAADGRYVDLLNNETISGVKTFAAQTAFTNAGAPFTVSNTNVVANLNADKLDGNDATAFVLAVNQQSFLAVVSSGADNMGVTFPSVFGSLPKIQTSVEVSQDIMYAVNIKNKTVSGFTAIFSDTIRETGVFLHVFASI